MNMSFIPIEFIEIINELWKRTGGRCIFCGEKFYDPDEYLSHILQELHIRGWSIEKFLERYREEYSKFREDEEFLEKVKYLLDLKLKEYVKEIYVRAFTFWKREFKSKGYIIPIWDAELDSIYPELCDIIIAVDVNTPKEKIREFLYEVAEKLGYTREEFKEFKEDYLTIRRLKGTKKLDLLGTIEVSSPEEVKIIWIHLC